MRIGRKVLLLLITNETIISQPYAEVCTFDRSVVCRKFTKFGEH